MREFWMAWGSVRILALFLLLYHFSISFFRLRIDFTRRALPTPRRRRKPTACQFVGGLRMWEMRGCADAHRLYHGIRGFQDLVGLQAVDSEYLARRFRALRTYVDGSTDLQADILAFAVRRDKGRAKQRPTGESPTLLVRILH